jgi:flagellin
MVINHNMSSIFASRMENLNTNALQSSMEKLSSGQKINKAGDDAAGLAISEKMRSQIRGLNQASRNVQNGVSFIQTTEGYLAETGDILQRIRELAVQSANGLYTDEDRMQIQVEVSQLVSEVDRIASSAQFNGMNMLTGRFAKEGGIAMSFQIGANVDQNISINVASATASALGLTGAQGEEGNTISIASADEANSTIATIDEALKTVNKQRADLGAVQNRMETAKKGIDVAAENITSSESVIRDEDMATAMVEYTKNQILQQSATAMLANANSQSQNVLALLR